MNAQTASEAAARKTKRWFFVVAGGVMVMIVVAGFWNSYFRPLVAGTSGKSGVIHFHAWFTSGGLQCF